MVPLDLPVDRAVKARRMGRIGVRRRACWSRAGVSTTRPRCPPKSAIGALPVTRHSRPVTSTRSHAGSHVSPRARHDDTGHGRHGAVGAARSAVRARVLAHMEADPRRVLQRAGARPTRLAPLRRRLRLARARWVWPAGRAGGPGAGRQSGHYRAGGERHDRVGRVHRPPDVFHEVRPGQGADPRGRRRLRRHERSRARLAGEQRP